MQHRSSSTCSAALLVLATLFATTSAVRAETSTGVRAQKPDAAAAAADLKAPPVLVSASGPQLLDAVKSTGARVVVVNLWATWCVPCREEFPDLMRFHRDYKSRGVALLLVSGDFASETGPAREFLASQGVDFPSYLKSGKDEELINTFDPQWSGALPATFVYDSKGQRRHSFLGPVTYESLEHEVAPLLGATP